MTTGKCRRCHDDFKTTELLMLPAGEKYVRDMAISSIKRTPPPAIPDDPTCVKNGYDLTDVFCPHCMKILLEQ